MQLNGQVGKQNIFCYQIKIQTTYLMLFDIFFNFKELILLKKLFFIGVAAHKRIKVVRNYY
jgi:hypothetical protein